MANTIKANVNLTGWEQAFARLEGPLKESLARRMGVSGSAVMEDEAKLRAPRSDGAVYNPKSRGSQQAGTLQDAIYKAYNEKLSVQDVQHVYSVSWNSKKAWWGKLAEFGHWQHQYVVGPDGMYSTPLGKNAPKVRWVAAEPFLGPAYDAKLGAAKAAMLERGRKELPILLAEKG